MEFEFMGWKLLIKRADILLENENEIYRKGHQKGYQKGLKDYPKIAVKNRAEKMKKTVEQKISSALNTMIFRGEKYSEYRLQKHSGLSLNTIKKYRSYTEQLLQKNGIKRQPRFDL